MKNFLIWLGIALVIFFTIMYIDNGVKHTAKNWEQGMEARKNYTPQDFKENYSIDLKQDGYLIVDSYDGECYFVPFGQLEDWFLEMNL